MTMLDRTKAAAIFVSLAVLLTIGCIGGGEEAPEETPAPAEQLSILAEGIRTGEIDVGTEYGMASNQRFHRIHATVIGMVCTQCHVKEAPLEIASASAGAPGPVDRRVCIGCHTTGPATKMYAP